MNESQGVEEDTNVESNVESCNKQAKPDGPKSLTVKSSETFYSDLTSEGEAEASIRPAPTKMELMRDDLLTLLNGNVSRGAAIFVAFLVIVDGAFFFFLLIGVHNMCSDPSPRNCDPRNYWYNFSIQFLNVNITYFALVSLPWKLAHAHHLSCSKRSCEIGRDLYGQPTEEIWYQISPTKRRIIVALFIGNSFAQLTNQSMRIVYSTYDLQSAWPGNLLTSVFFFTSFSCAFMAAMGQLHEQASIRKQQPGQFPLGPAKIARIFMKQSMTGLEGWLGGFHLGLQEEVASPVNSLGMDEKKQRLVLKEDSVEEDN